MIAATSNGRLSTGVLTGTGTIRLDNGAGANALTINQSGNSAFGGAIVDAPGKSGTFIKTGAGVLTLAQAPRNSGGFALNGGGLVLPAGGTLSLSATGTLTAASGTTISYTGLTVSGGTLSGAGTHNVGAGASFTGTSVAGGTTINANRRDPMERRQPARCLERKRQPVGEQSHGEPRRNPCRARRHDHGVGGRGA